MAETRSFPLVRFIASFLQTLAYLSLLLMAVAVVGVVIAGNPEKLPLGQLAFGTFAAIVVPYLISAVLFFALGSALKLLLLLESRTPSK